MYTSMVNYSYYVFLLSFEREGDQDYKGMHIVSEKDLSAPWSLEMVLLSAALQN